MTQNNTANQVNHDDYGHRHAPLDWTIMVYIAGDNNLSAHSIAILQELETARRREGVRVLACYDSNAPLPKGARYLEIQHRRQTKPYPMNWGLHNDLVDPGHTAVSPDFCNPDPTSVKPIDEPDAREGLSRFLRWALKHHPAKRYMLILFGHGVLVAGNTFLSDTTPPSFLRLKDFARIIKSHFGKPGDYADGKPKPRLDILGLDNCVMNGIEAAYELREHVDFMIGSQDLMLAVGWPFRKIIQAVHPKKPTKIIALRILKACARRLLDYSLMERSSEQAICDLTVLRESRLTTAVHKLADALKKGLKTDKCGRICYPEIRDGVKLARLEAQSYWNESFVDLYDFCELLLKQYEKWLSRQLGWFEWFQDRPRVPPCRPIPMSQIRSWFLATEKGKGYTDIADACKAVLTEFKLRKPEDDEDPGIVPYSYYVGSDLQYSHGLSIYFPWAMPENPIIFEPDEDHSSYPPKNYKLRTAFDEYKDYDFAKPDGGDWANFLIQFFRATLRNVRLVDYDYSGTEASLSEYDKDKLREDLAPGDPQKSSPDTGEEEDYPRFSIKNYPRRFYLSPQDCAYKSEPCQNDPSNYCPKGEEGTDPSVYQTHHVPELGWKIRGLLAKLIAWSRDDV